MIVFIYKIGVIFEMIRTFLLFKRHKADVQKFRVNFSIIIITDYRYVIASQICEALEESVEFAKIQKGSDWFSVRRL